MRPILRPPKPPTVAPLPPLAAPVAKTLLMAPNRLTPKKPPTTLLAPPVTLPVACEPVMDCAGAGEVADVEGDEAADEAVGAAADIAGRVGVGDRAAEVAADQPAGKGVVAAGDHTGGMRIRDRAGGIEPDQSAKPAEESRPGHRCCCRRSGRERVGDRSLVESDQPAGREAAGHCAARARIRDGPGIFADESAGQHGRAGTGDGAAGLRLRDLAGIAADEAADDERVVAGDIAAGEGLATEPPSSIDPTRPPTANAFVPVTLPSRASW